MQTPETFKDILWYEGLYQVSDNGNVMGVKKGRVLKPGAHTKGYSRVYLHKEGVQNNYYVHRLVAIAFIDNPDSKEQVNHIDWVRNNNSISNLEWCTAKENIRHSRDVLGNMIGEKHPNYGKFWVEHNSSKTVIQLTREGKEVNRFWSTREAHRETGVHQGDICQVCLWKQKTAGGFVWNYA